MDSSSFQPKYMFAYGGLSPKPHSRIRWDFIKYCVIIKSIDYFRKKQTVQASLHRLNKNKPIDESEKEVITQ